MFYIKLTSMGFLVFYASLYFVNVEAEGFRLDAAKQEIRAFLHFLLNEVGFPNELLDVENAQNLAELTFNTNAYINDEILDTIDWFSENNLRRHTFLSEVYTQYQYAFIRLLEEDVETVNNEIPLAHKLAESLCINRTVFRLDQAKQHVVGLLHYFSVLLGKEENYQDINDAGNFDELLDEATLYLNDHEILFLGQLATGQYNQSIPATMQSQFPQYLGAMLQLMNEDPVTRGKAIPLHDVIMAISVWFPPHN